MRKVHRFNSREEWLNARKGGIGASEVATILGINPFCTPYQLWRLKKGIDSPVQENFAMRAGHYLEDAVAKFYADETGAHIIQSSAEDFIFTNTNVPYIQVSPDRTFWEAGKAHNNQNKCILECKTTQRMIDKDNIPNYWYIQLQTNLGVSEFEHGALAWLIQGRDFDYRNYALDKDFFKFLSEETARFYTDYIVGDKEPSAMSATDILLKHPRHIEGKIAKASNDILNTIERLKVVKNELKRFDTEKDELEDIIKVAMADAEFLEGNGGEIVATWKSGKDTSKFNSKKFASENPELHAKYIEVQAGARRFNLK